MFKKILLAVVAAVAASVAWAAYSLNQPQGGPFPRERCVEIPKGTGTRQIAAVLAREGIIGAPWQLLAVRALRPTARLQAGEYGFSKPATAWQIFDRLVRGDVRLFELRVPEGSNLFDIAEAVEALGLASKEAFRAAASDPSPIRDLDPAATNLEGYLFPSTYRVSRKTTAAQICRLMTDQFRAVWKRLDSTEPPRPIVTMASLVEKETGLPAERPTVAGVYRNRLARGIKLECDPTTIYAALLQDRYRGKIYRSDLDNMHPYNTYRHTGLPPGPIANPGEASLRAALHPAATDHLFFVAKTDGSGGHNFSPTLREHARAVAEYRRAEKRTAAPAVARGR